MNRREVIAAAIAAPLACADRSYDGPYLDLLYRLKVRIVVGGTIREGSGVLRSVFYDVDKARVWGEAIPIDMGGGEHLFAILRGIDTPVSVHGFWPGNLTTFDRILRPDGLSNVFQSYMHGAEISGEHDAGDYCRPNLIRYRDLNDPATAEFVEWLPEPAGSVSSDRDKHPEWRRTIAEIYGNDARVERVTLELVREPVTQRMARLLPFLGQLEGADGSLGFRLHGPADKLSSYLNYFHFKLDGYDTSGFIATLESIGWKVPEPLRKNSRPDLSPRRGKNRQGRRSTP